MTTDVSLVAQITRHLSLFLKCWRAVISEEPLSSRNNASPFRAVNGTSQFLSRQCSIYQLLIAQLGTKRGFYPFENYYYYLLLYWQHSALNSFRRKIYAPEFLRVNTQSFSIHTIKERRKTHLFPSQSNCCSATVVSIEHHSVSCAGALCSTLITGVKRETLLRMTPVILCSFYCCGCCWISFEYFQVPSWMECHVSHCNSMLFMP